MTDYSVFDRPGLLKFLFYPRRDHTPCPEGAFDIAVPVDQDVSVTCRFYPAAGDLPWMLYFHGNGEVASDYDQIAPLYHQAGLNIVVADYRGYGTSQGTPTFSSLVRDAHSVFSAVGEILAEKNFPPGLWVMGRSMGSVPALELAYNYQDRLKGVIIESGFLSVTGLIRHLGLPAEGVDTGPFDRRCGRMASEIRIPALVIHGEKDRIVPLDQGRLLFEALGSTVKKMVVIPGADHNDILFFGLNRYFGAIREFTALKA